MLHCGPFKGIENAWDDDDFARFLAHLVGNGVYPNPSTGLQVIQNENMTVVVKMGAAWINGRFLYSDSDIILNFGNADGVLKRIDRVIIRLNQVDRKIEIIVKQGTFASTPVAPTLQRDADFYELALADVLINAGATAITQANITDQRLNNDLCGIVHGLVDQVDTTTIFNQYEAWYNQFTDDKSLELDTWTIEKEQAFNDWFATIQGILSGDVAGNLANHITSLEQQFTQYKVDNAKQIKIKQGITILSTEWSFNSLTNLWEYNIVDSDIFNDTIVDVNIKVIDLEKANNFLSSNESFNGYVQLYSELAPIWDISCDLKLIRAVV